MPSRRLVASTARCARERTGRSAGALKLAGFRFGFDPDAVVLYRRRESELARMKQLWTRGRWYREWAPPFVPLGAEAPNDPRRTRPNRRPSHPPRREAPPGPRGSPRRCLEPRRHLVVRVEAEANRALTENARVGTPQGPHFCSSPEAPAPWPEPPSSLVLFDGLMPEPSGAWCSASGGYAQRGPSGCRFERWPRAAPVTGSVSGLVTVVPSTVSSVGGVAAA